MKWGVDEDLTLQAIRLVREHDLLAPDIAKIEAANALLKKVRRRELPLADAMLSIVSLTRYLEFTEAVPSFEAAIELAAATGCTVYDGVYVVTAQTQDCPLVTADERLQRTLGPAYRQTVLWLGDLPV